MKKAIIIIPTYNEAVNIARMLEHLQTVFSRIADYDMGVLVYDSNSPDNTADIVKSYQTKFPNIYLLTEEKKSGLGNAYIQAMKYAHETLHADIVFEFDADGSHNPEYLPDMMNEFTRGADVVLGSRYVKGGSIPKDWAMHRKFLSVFGNIAAKIVLSPKIKDYTTGFRGTRTALLRKIDLDHLKSKSYAYKIHLIWLLHSLGAKIVEFPIEFIDRTAGVSKLPKNNAIESLWLICYLRYLLLKRYLQVCAVGGVGLIVQLVFFNTLRQWLHPVYANMVSVECAVVSNFILNNYFSFAEKRLSSSDKVRTWLKKFGVFNLFSLGSLLLQSVILFIGCDLFGRSVIAENMYVLVGIGLGSIYNYKIYHYFVWRK